MKLSDEDANNRISRRTELLLVTLVQRFLDGEAAQDLAAEAGLSSPQWVKAWARKYRREGVDALRAKPKRATQRTW
ncbi:helix-turn-helix domain-containing protein [Arthrobacter vasquezii]|uniref:helix-turn-helix domain-containing protein n=1 Tax=Arthrobacter vasquezii TaxID=2977629 RepID=UPI00384BCB5D